MSARAQFASIKNSTAADWQVILQEQKQFVKGLPDRILQHLRLLSGDYGGFPIDRLQHSLQTATLAHTGGEDDEYVVCALLHDIGDTLGSFSHPDVAAAILQPFVSEANHWMVKHHGIFQGYYFFHHVGMDRNMRDQFKDHPYFEKAARFCEIYDNPAFNTKRQDTRTLEFFEPMVRKVFATPQSGMYKVLAKGA